MRMFALLLLAGLPTAPIADSLDALLAQFRAVPGLEARFREEKHLRLLASPLISEGVIRFAPPQRFLRQTTTPIVSAVLIDRGQLSFGDAHGSESLSLSANPVARLFVDSFLKLLEGDRASLDAIYEINWKPTGTGWSLMLKPKVKQVAQVIERLEMVGKGVVLERMRVVEVGGDETVTVFTDVNATRRFSSEELPRLFRLPAP